MLKTVPSFQGVFAIDTIPKELIKPSCGVVNLEEHDERGSHWVCWCYRDELPVYFDSFGVEPDDRILELLKQNPQELVLGTTGQIQDITSNACGKYCAKFIESYMKKKMSLPDSLDMFTPYPTAKNEKLVDKMKIPDV